MVNGRLVDILFVVGVLLKLGLHRDMACGRILRLTYFVKPSHFCKCSARGVHRPFSLGVVPRAASLIGSDNYVHSPRPPLQLSETSLGEHLMSKLEQYNSLEALVDLPTKRRLTFTQLKEAVVRVSSALSKLGIGKGDVIGVCSLNCLEYVVLVVAVANLGAVLSPVNPASTVDDLRRQFQLSGAMAVVGEKQFVEGMDEACLSIPSLKVKIVIGSAEGWRPFSTLMEDDGQAFSEPVPVNPLTDLALLPYSSGTTGLPKGVMLSHSNILVNMLQFFQAMPSTAGKDRVLAYLPFFHAYGLNGKILYCINAGVSMSIIPRFDETFLDIMAKERITMLHLVPPVLLYMLKHPGLHKADLSAVRTAICAAAPIGRDQVVAFRELTGLEDFIQGYGLTEVSPLATVDSSPVRVGSVGQLLSSTTVKVVDIETGEVLGPEQTGEICIKGPQVMMGYYGNPEATVQTLRDGWLHSGDVGHFETNGHIYVTDRVKELIKYNAQQVAPAELEALLLTHPSIQDAAVIGVPDPKAGEVPKAYVVLKPATGSDVTPESVAKFLEEKVANYKKLRGGVEFINIIPKSPSGKILRRVLRESLG